MDKIKDERLLHTMMFVDPGSPENLDMNMLKKLLKDPGDLLTLLHPGIFAEMVNKKRYEVGTLESMLDIQNREAEKMRTNTQAPYKLINLYVDKYKEAVKYTEVEGLRNKITEVSIKTGEAYYTLL